MNDKLEELEDEKEDELFDHFAGLAMQALLAAKADEFLDDTHGAQRLARLSYKCAEHMMTARLKYEADT